MKRYVSTPVGRLRAVGFLEGISLLVLLFVAMPVKYWMGDPALVRSVGMAHGILFLLFVFLTLSVSLQQGWSFFRITWKILLSSIIPFGTFYVDKKVLAPLEQR